MSSRIVIITICLLGLTGFNHSEEEEIISVVRLMIEEINEKDAEGYINLLSDYFIRVTYGDRDFIRRNISKIGFIELLEVNVIEIKSYYSIVHYKLLHNDPEGNSTVFSGEIILERVANGWKVYSVTERYTKSAKD